MKCRVGQCTLLVILVAMPTCAFGGPPFKTDDPQPVDVRHWEFYLASMQELERHATSATAPHIEVNFGAISNMQLHLVAPLGYAHDGGGTHYGYADTELGVKYRVLDETEDLPQVGVFPLVELPTGNETRGLGSGRTQVYLPLWLQKSWGKLTTYGGVGWWYNPGEGRRNWTFAGWEAQYDVSELLTFGGEFYYQSPDNRESASRVGFNAGGFINITANHHILFSIGRTLSLNETVTGYIGYQLTI